MRYRFGEFVLDASQSVLTGPEGRVALRPKAYALLRLLIERAPALISHDEIIDRIWGHSALSRNVLPQTVRELRMALGDTDETPRFIETQHRRGYRWIVPVEVDEAPSPTVVTADATPGHGSIHRNAGTYRTIRLLFGALVFALLVGAIAYWRSGLKADPPSITALVAVEFSRGADGTSEFPALSLLDTILRNHVQVLPSTAADVADARLVFSAPGGDAVHWQLIPAGAASASASGSYAPESAWADLESLLAAIARHLDRSSIDFSDVWPKTNEGRSMFAAAMQAAGIADIAQARRLLIEVLRTESEAIGARAVLVDLAMRNGYWNTAREFVAAPENDSKPTATRERFRTILQSHAAILAGQPTLAADAYADWLDRYPDDLTMRLWQAGLWLDQARADLAFGSLGAVQAELASAHPDALLVKFRTAMMSGDRFEAGKLFDLMLAWAVRATPNETSHVLPMLAQETRRASDLAGWKRLEPLLEPTSDEAVLRTAQWNALAGDAAVALSTFEQLHRHAVDRGQLRLSAETAYDRSVLLNRRGETGMAADELRAAIALATTEGDPRSLADLGLSLATVLANSGDPVAARTMLVDAQSQADFLADPRRQAAILTNLGMQLGMQSRTDEAEAAIARARDLFRRMADLRGELINITNLGALESRRGQLAKARDLYNEGLMLAERSGDKVETARAAFNLGLTETRLDNVVAARERLQQAKTTFIASGGRTSAARAAALLAEIEIAGADLKAAERTLADFDADTDLPVVERSRLLLARARIEELKGDDVHARATLTLARTGYAQAGPAHENWLRVIDVRLARLAVRAGAPVSVQLARVSVLRQEMERADAEADALKAALTQVELTACAGKTAEPIRNLQALEPALEAARIPDQLLRADLLSARIARNDARLNVLAEEAETRHHRLAALYAERMADGQRLSDAGILRRGLDHCVSTAF